MKCIRTHESSFDLGSDATVVLVSSHAPARAHPFTPDLERVASTSLLKAPHTVHGTNRRAITIVTMIYDDDGEPRFHHNQAKELDGEEFVPAAHPSAKARPARPEAPDPPVVVT